MDHQSLHHAKGVDGSLAQGDAGSANSECITITGSKHEDAKRDGTAGNEEAQERYQNAHSVSGSHDGYETQAWRAASTLHDANCSAAGVRAML